MELSKIVQIFKTVPVESKTKSLECKLQLFHLPQCPTWQGGEDKAFQAKVTLNDLQLGTKHVHSTGRRRVSWI